MDYPRAIAKILGDESLAHNYVLHPSPEHHYWANISAGTLGTLKSQFGENFNLVLVGSVRAEADFYTVPYAVLRLALVEVYRTNDKTGRLRWTITVKNHQMKVGNYPTLIDVAAFYGLPPTAIGADGAPTLSAAERNDYAIENRKIEIEQRQKQSLFRKRVLANFGGRCCLSDVTERDLLTASHIVPWSHRIESRLDPRNGLLFHSLYDRLFDQGYISLADSFRVLVIPWIDECSPALAVLLKDLARLQVRRPRKWAIRADFLAYHRENVFRSKRA
jgi:putative restriction endonuclease